MASPAPALPLSTPATTKATSASTGWQKLAKDVFAGTCGGISVTLVGHPFDTIKVRLQTQSATNPMYCECQQHQQRAWLTI